MLVSAFAGTDHIKQAYQHAIDHGYRFFSYGDAMFLEKFWLIYLIFLVNSFDELTSLFNRIIFYEFQISQLVHEIEIKSIS